MGFLEDIAQYRISFEVSGVGDENLMSLGDFYEEIAEDFEEDVEDSTYSVVSEYDEDVFAVRDGDSVELFGYSDLVSHSANILASEYPELGLEAVSSQYELEKKNGMRVVAAIDALLP